MYLSRVSLRDSRRLSPSCHRILPLSSWVTALPACCHQATGFADTDSLGRTYGGAGIGKIGFHQQDVLV